MGLIAAIIFSICYGFNHLLLEAALLAHSEALFVFTFNAAFLFMSFYFIKEKKVLYLLLFSLFAGLNMSTKVNGLMLVTMFIVSSFILYFVMHEKKVKHILLSFIPILISLGIFVSLNPFTYSNIYKNVWYLFDHRMVTALLQADKYPERYLPNGISRMTKIFENFYFSKTKFDYSRTIFENRIFFDRYGIYLLTLFTIGFLYSLKLSWQRNLVAIVTCGSFITMLMMMGY
jgi:hypothetical protein